MTDEGDSRSVITPSEFIQCLSKHSGSVAGLLGPYLAHEHALRENYMRQEHVAETENLVLVFSPYTGYLKIRHPRGLDPECYILPLSERKAEGTLAIVSTLQHFQANLDVYSERILTSKTIAGEAMDWNNVVVAGGAVTLALQAVSTKSADLVDEFTKISPSGDIDLFLYDLTEGEALEKVKKIVQFVRSTCKTQTTFRSPPVL